MPPHLTLEQSFAATQYLPLELKNTLCPVLASGQGDLLKVISGWEAGRPNQTNKLLQELRTCLGGPEDIRTLSQNLLRDLSTHRIVVLYPGHRDFPRFAANGDEMTSWPLFALGDLSLLHGTKAALLVSRRKGSQKSGGKWLDAAMLLCKQLSERGLVVVTGAELGHYEAVRHKTSKLDASRIVVFDEPLIGGWTEEEVPERCLLMSHFAFKDAGFSEVDRMRARDRLIGLLADKLIAVTVRPGGNMHDTALRALKSSKPVAACHISVESSATEELIQAGAKPVTIEHAGISLDEFLGTPAEAGEQQDPSRREERQRDLGQFFTPRCVAEFMWRCVGAFRRTLGSGGKEIRAIDPAAGEGIFLEAAPASGSAFGELIGVDVDSQLRSGWSRSLSGQTHTRLHVADGLIDLPWLAVERGSFDVVIGNPPFGGRGLAILERVLAEMLPMQGDLFGASQSQPRRTSGTELTFGKKIAVEMLNHYETWRRTEALQLLRSDQKTAGPSIAESQRPLWRPRETKQAALVREGVDRRDELEARELQTLTYDGGPITSLVKKALTRLVSFPIEVLFVERFVQLAKPGGTIAVIVPDGIVANEQTRYLRSWIRNRADLLAVVALPRGTFSGVASNVDTSILFLRKKGPENGAAPKTIIMAHPGEFGKGQIERYLGDVEAGIASWTPETE